MSRRSLARSAAIAAALLLLAPLTACSDEAKDNASDTVESVKDDVAEGADEVQARSTAEALRASLKANDTADKEGMRSMKAINEAIDDLPGDPEVTGAEDGNGDGLDDDGKLQVSADESQACLTLPETGEDTKVEDGAC